MQFSRLMFLSILWFAWNAQWRTVPLVLVPNQLLLLLGGDATRAEFATGCVLAAGALVSLLVTPIAGALSDQRRRSPTRRLDYIVAGVAGTCVALAALSGAGETRLAWYLLAYLNLQFWWNWAAGPFAGLIPDVVPPAHQSTASGWMNALGIAGAIAGNLIVFACYEPGRPGLTLAWLSVLNVGCLIATLVGLRKVVARERCSAAATRPLFAMLRIPCAENQDFYRSMVARLLTNLGVWSILSFLGFYLQFVVGLSQQTAAALLPGLLAAATIAGIPTSLAAGPLIQRAGMLPAVRLSAWIMALSAALFCATAFSPSVPLIVVTLVLFGMAHGIFGAADWALALRLLPRRSGAASSLGIWHACMVLPQVVGPLTTGVMITVAKHAFSVPAAYGLAFAVAVGCFVAGAQVVATIRLPNPGQAVSGSA